ncbi:hypothetical protein PanWU01x14_285390 [Parasponia andersonii]|uniref:Uncharacterized protein n=1 Tax=Parasponia andersonii TaxID=3476 RepID=A0A2P5AZL6_PARAD|nr:hypothetical protein PanWU01x14_285390 [Parasponia andersonii]
MNLVIVEENLALTVEEPSKLDDSSSDSTKKFYNEWQYSNRYCLMIIRYHIEESIHDSIHETKTAKEFLVEVDKKYVKFVKSEKEYYSNLLHTTYYDGVSGIKNHVVTLKSFFQKLKGMNMNLGDDFLVWHTMRYLPSQFDLIRSSYND